MSLGAWKREGPEPFLDVVEGLVMERVLLQQRRIWFAAHLWESPAAQWCSEAEGEMIMLVQADPAGADALVAEARQRRAFVVVTPFTQPGDLAHRLVCSGFRRVQAQGTYVYRPGHTPPPVPAAPSRRRFNLTPWRQQEPLELTVEAVGLGDLVRWNRTCWRAFMPRGLSEVESLVEKTRAFRNMGGAARWYLALHRGQPVATSILHQGDGAAILMAVGTEPRWRGRGIATVLVHRAVADHAAHGQGFLFLDTQPGGNAERLYLGLGFVPAYVREVYGT